MAQSPGDLSHIATVPNSEVVYIDASAPRADELRPSRDEYVSSNRVLARRLCWLQHPPKHTPRWKPHLPTPPIAKATASRIKATWPRRRHSGDFYRAEAKAKREARREAADPVNEIAKAVRKLRSRLRRAA